MLDPGLSTSYLLSLWTSQKATSTGFNIILSRVMESSQRDLVTYWDAASKHSWARRLWVPHSPTLSLSMYFCAYVRSVCMKVITFLFSEA